MKNGTVTFITGNQSKAEYLSKYLGLPVGHTKIDLIEVQSLDLREVVEHKVREAYAQVQQPVIVDDVSLEFAAYGRLPGTFIKFYLEEMTLEQICRLLDERDRSATARCVMGYYDGVKVTLFEGTLKGKIAHEPQGEGGFGWDRIFIPDGYTVTRASLNESDDQKTYLRIKPFAKLKTFLEST